MANEATLGTVEVTLYEPSEAYERYVRDRVVVYLDNNLWITLVDGKTEDARACREECRIAKAADLAIFPLSYGSVSEVLDQPPEAPRDAQARLMDELSSGVTFRTSKFVHEAEARYAFDHLVNEHAERPDRAEVFSFMPDFVGEGHLTFPPGWTASNIGAFRDALRSSPEMRSVAWLVGHLPLDEFRERHARSGERYREEMEASLCARCGQCRASSTTCL